MRDGTALIRTADDPLIGVTIAERYVIEALVGEGAMGLVYRAHHARLSRLFAIKLMFGDVAADASMRMRFAQEADAASRMSHPNVVSVLDFGKTEGGLLYLVMEYAEGDTLATILRREGPQPEQRVIGLARQMARGLGHAHQAELVHRDFKPANISVSTGGDGGELVRILDFGLAIAEGDGNRIGRLTEHGLVVGTPIYISPEQARDHNVDHRADLFALGVVMYEMLAGKPPFEGNSHEIARANVTQTPPPIAQRNPQVSVSPELEAVVLKLMAKKPADRYQSTDEVVTALGRLGRRAVPLPPALVVDEPEERGSSSPLRSPVQWLLDKSAHLGWGSTRTTDASDATAPGWDRRPAAIAATSAETVVDVGPFDAGATAAATLIDAAPFGGGQPAPAVSKAPQVTWGVQRDAQPTEGMTPASMRRADGVARHMRRRGVAAAAWLALATSGVVCTMMEGPKRAAGQSEGDASAAHMSLSGTDDPAEGPDTLVWVRAVAEQIRSGIDRIGVRQGRTAGGRFEGKMGTARARRCPTVQNAEPTGVGQSSSTRARSADTGPCPPSAPRSPRARQARPETPAAPGAMSGPRSQP
jgi:serine/threonine protein kinase